MDVRARWTRLRAELSLAYAGLASATDEPLIVDDHPDARIRPSRMRVGGELVGMATLASGTTLQLIDLGVDHPGRWEAAKAQVAGLGPIEDADEIQVRVGGPIRSAARLHAVELGVTSREGKTDEVVVLFRQQERVWALRVIGGADFDRLFSFVGDREAVADLDAIGVDIAPLREPNFVLDVLETSLQQTA